MENSSIKLKKVLVVDDDLDILEAIKLILENRGYSAKTVSIGSEVFEVAKKFKPDVIVLDVLLSGYDGRLICKQLKSDKATKNTPVVLMSAHPTARQSSAEAGANSFISKPFSVDGFVSQIEKHVG